MKNSMKMHRAICNITQEDLAARVGVTRQAIIAIEHGKYVPSAVLAMKIAREFNKPFEEVFSLEETD
ncbi:MAG: helix-turn-helix transcriptional regulator [Bacteroidales bacterium]|nr:helix-turn-helix transcriptional regulator [Bacteroidales bacterium]